MELQTEKAPGVAGRRGPRHDTAMALFEFGEEVPGYPVRVLNEREARAAAGIMFACGLAMFVYSLQTMDFRYSRIFITLFMVDFLIRVFVNPRLSPTMILGRIAVSRQAPEYVGAAQKRFAWSIGVLLSVPMFVLVVILGMMTPWKIAICGVCLLLMFFETAFGICVGCVPRSAEIAGTLRRAATPAKRPTASTTTRTRGTSSPTRCGGGPTAPSSASTGTPRSVRSGSV
jgi:hypothetical protein